MARSPRRSRILLGFGIVILAAGCSETQPTDYRTPAEFQDPRFVLSSAFDSYNFSPLTLDDAGPNDTPSQTDLNAFARADNVANTVAVEWKWDDINSWFGTGQTGDACALFDNDNQGQAGFGNADYAVCVRIKNNPDGSVVQLAGLSPQIYSCGDKKTDRCAQPVAGPQPLQGTFCEVVLDTETSFGSAGTGEDGQDVLAACSIPKVAIGDPSSPNLLNVCSFPSGEPNSNPFDCVVTPGVGFLQIVKKTVPDSSEITFSFTLSPAASDGTTSFSLTDDQMNDEATGLIPVDPGSYDLAEDTLPDGWLLDDAYCVRGDPPVGTGTKDGAAVEGLVIAIGETTICTFENIVGAPDVSVTKTADPTEIPETGGTVTFSVEVTNNSLLDVTLSSLVDDVFGDLDGQGTCATGGSIAAGGTYSCEFDQLLPPATAGDTHVDTVEVTVTNAGGSDSDDDDATVTYADVAPTVTVTKTPSPTAVPETGGDVTFTVEVTNDADEAVTLTSLVDDVFGDLNGEGTCVTGGTIAAGGTYSCSFAKEIIGDVGESHVDTVAVTVTDDDGSTAQDDDDATVTFTDVGPSIEVTKTAAPTSVPETGGLVTFTVEVTNDGTEAVTLTVLNDDQFGDLDGQGTCDVPQALAVAASYSCSFQYSLADAAGESHTNIVTATAYDNDGSSDTDTDTATVTFTDVAPVVTVTKTADPDTVPETGDDVTFTVLVENDGTVPFTLTSLTDDQFGDLDGKGDCATGGSIPVDGSYSCSFTEFLDGAAGTDHTNVVTAVGTDAGGTTDDDTDDATVEFEDVAPVIEVTKTADPTSVPETGGNVTFTVLVENDGTVPFELTSLTDDQFGDLDGKGDCATGGTIAVGGSFSCSFTESLSGTPGGSHVNTVTALGTDDDGTTDTDTDDATVSYTDVAPVIAVTKTASPTAVAETGDTVTFSVLVENEGTVPFDLTSLTDDQFGDLNGKGDCATGGSIAAGGSYSCSFKEYLTGGPDSIHADTVTAIGTDANGTTDTARDDATVSFDDVLVDISVTKTADPTSLSFSSGGGLGSFTPDRTYNTNPSGGGGGFEYLSPTCDDAGANDVPAQVDLNCFNRADNLSGKLGVQWTWDDINSWSGAGQTGDGCALLDTDGDGNANVAVCARITNSPDGTQVLQVGGNGAVDVYVCNDTKADRCAKQVTQLTLAQEKNTTCTIAVVTPDGIAGGDDGADVQASCDIDLTITPLSGQAIDLLNVCSFPSGEPNSNPFDCVVQAGAGFIQIVKTVNVTTTDLFGFTLSPASTDGTNEYAVLGGITTGLIPVLPTNSASLTEVLPSGWSLATASCTVNGSSTGTFSATNKRVSGISVLKGQTTVCTFDNDAVVSGDVEYTIVVTNHNAEEVTLVLLDDDIFNDLDGVGDCEVGVSIAGGDTYTCKFTKTLSGAPGTSHVNTVTAKAEDDDGNDDTDTDDATVTFENASP